MHCEIAIFDFDGTIAETGPGILNSARYALGQMGRPDPGEDVLRRFVGPPLFDSFQVLCGLSACEAEEAIRLYRERYSTIGLFESELYPGVPELLRELKTAGAWVAVASGKPEAFLRRIIRHFGLTDCFDGVAGPAPGSHSADKRAQVLSVLPQGADLRRAWMVGDRCFDVDAGRALGMHTVAVGYGYGSREEFEASGAECIVDTVEELRSVLL